MALSLTYTTVAAVVAEARLKGHLNNVFTTAEVEQICEAVFVIVNNYTDKTSTSPWTSGDEVWALIVQATTIGSAGFLLQQFANKQDEGQKKIDLMYKVLRNIIYGEGSPDSEGGSGTPQYSGNIHIGAGSFEIAELEMIENADIDQDSVIGSQ